MAHPVMLMAALALAIGGGVGCSGGKSIADAAAAVTGQDTAVSATPGNTCRGPASARVELARVPAGHCAWTWAADLSGPRGLAVAENGDLLVVDKGRVLALWDADGDGVSGKSERVVLATSGDLNHGIAIRAGFLYASGPGTVYRWAYQTGDRRGLGVATTVVKGIPSDGHNTRTVVFDGQGRLYVHLGSASNVDADSSHALIRRFTLPITVPAGGIAFTSGELFAHGMRNEVGLAFDGMDRLWGVENGSDDLARADLGGDIHNDNPAEELNLFAQPGKFYGYPYCATERALPANIGKGPGTQWAMPGTMNDGVHTDSWCRDPANVVPPKLAMPAHVAPLDLLFYSGTSFPADMRGDAIVTWHGSWNRDPAQGYKVVRIPMKDGSPTGEIRPLLEWGGAGDRGAGWIRPVAVRQGRDGELYVSSDETGEIIAIGYSP